MQALAVYNRPVSSAAIDYLLQFHLPGINSAPLLDRLVSMHFARREAMRYSLHPVDREFAHKKIPQLDETKKKLGQGARARLWSRFALTLRAADYYREARKPVEDWKSIDDLAPQLAEFNLRCTASDFDSAAVVLADIDFNYLLLWGHYNLMIDLHEKLQGKVNDGQLARASAGNLGLAYAQIGQERIAIKNYEKVLELAQQDKNRHQEGAALHGLGNHQASLGKTKKAIEYYEQALVIFGEISYRGGEATGLGNLGNALLSLNDFQGAQQLLSEATQTADEILDAAAQLECRRNLARCFLFQNDFKNAQKIIDAALQYDVPEYTYRASLLKSIILLRQNELENAGAAFHKALAQADEILAKTPELYGALDAKGLALCGLVLTTDDSLLRDDYHLQAIETFKKARQIAPHAGVVKCVLRLFDELVKCDNDGALEELRRLECWKVEA